MNDEKIAEELLAETRTPQEAYEYAIRREKGVEHSKTMKLNPIGTTSSVAIKQEQVGYIQPKGRRGGFSSPFQNNNRGKYSRGRQNQNTRGNQNRNTQNYASKKQCTKMEIRLAQTIFNHVQPEIKFARNVQNVHILQKSVVKSCKFSSK